MGYHTYKKHIQNVGTWQNAATVNAGGTSKLGDCIKLIPEEEYPSNVLCSGNQYVRRDGSDGRYRIALYNSSSRMQGLKSGTASNSGSLSVTSGGTKISDLSHSVTVANGTSMSGHSVWLALISLGADKIRWRGDIDVYVQTTDKTYTLTTAVSPSGGGTCSVSPTGAQMKGTKITVTATPSTNWKLLYKKYGSTTISNNTFSMPNSNTTVTAYFEKIYTACTAPGSVSVSRTGRNGIAVSWTAGGAGTNNAISNYHVGYSTSSGGSFTASSTVTGTSTTFSNVAVGTYYCGVRTQGAAGASYYSGYKWSGSVNIPAHPTVSAGNSMTKANMDTLKSYINTTVPTTVTQYALATAANANTYKSSSATTATAINASWYNNV